jgi:hypothetical protein
LALIFAQLNAAKGLAAASSLAKELEADHPDAAASLREGLAKRTTGRVTKWKERSMKEKLDRRRRARSRTFLPTSAGIQGHAQAGRRPSTRTELANKVTPAVDTAEEYDQEAA